VVTWRYLDAAGGEVGESPAFPDRAGAEAWIGASWVDLRDRGVDAVELVDDEGDEPVYRMSLADGS